MSNLTIVKFGKVHKSYGIRAKIDLVHQTVWFGFLKNYRLET